MEAIKNIGILSAQVLADYVLHKYGPMSHLKLQKLLYYCDAYHLAYFDQPLIKEEFQAWVHGPVCREVFDNLKEKSLIYADLGFSGEHDPERPLLDVLSSDQFELVEEILSELSTWKGFELENATHKETPWVEARAGFSPADRCENIISKETMRTFYKKDLNVGEKDK